MRKNLWRHISFSSTCSYYYRKHPDQDNKICPQPSFVTNSQYLGTIQIRQNLNKCHYYLTSTKSVICQIDPNCSPFQLLNMLLFYIRLELLKLIFYRLIYFFLYITLKLAHSASFIFPCIHRALEFDSNYFSIVPWKMLKPRDHNETKPPIGKIFQKYKPIRHYFVMPRK